MTNGTGFRNRISTEARLRQTKNIGAIVDDLVTMSNEYHRVIRMLTKNLVSSSKSCKFEV